MPELQRTDLLDAILDSWDRNNTILVNLLRALPADALGSRSTPDGPTAGQIFSHIHSVRLFLVVENVPERAVEVPAEEWLDERNAELLARQLGESADTVREAVRARIEAGRATDLNFDHPVLFLQHMIWHEGYHHGQIKLALKLEGRPLADEVVGPLTWGVWMRKTSPAP